MRSAATAVLLAATLTLLGPLPASAADGKWTPQQVLEIGDARLKALGLQIPAKRLWDPERGTGLLAATVWIDGCSGAFVSETGLLVTNHHCLFSVLQEHSSPERNLIDDGFLARSQDQELRAKTERVRVARRFTDVTKDLLAAIPTGADDLQRAKAIERKGKELVAECEKRPATRCQVASFDGGLFYTLIDSLELSDVRLVYAPPRAVGEFGGEIDNWTWPRHTGDFAIARAYGADGKPFKPEFFLPFAQQGVAPGDFVMVMGYPGRTFRALTAAEMAERKELFFARRVEVYGEWIALLEQVKDRDGAILVADDLKSLRNRRKNAQGQIAGFERGRILEKVRAQERETLNWTSKLAGHDLHATMLRDALVAHGELEKRVESQRRSFDRDFLIDHLTPTGLAPSKAFAWPTTLVRAARERMKPDLQRDPAFMDRNLPRLKQHLEREQKRFFAPADQALTASFIRRALALPSDQRIAAIDRAFGKVKPERIEVELAKLYRRSKVFDPKERLKMSEESEAQLRARGLKDPLLEIGFALADEVTKRQEQKDRDEGAISRLRPAWRRAVLAHAGRPIAPDANGTLRVSFARVRGYSPRDGLFATPQTTLSGVMAKMRNERPFLVPAKVADASRARSFNGWADPALGDVPVNFLADADTTGGNSGSPTVNARGELVGVNFDRVWENVANDFGYNPEVARNVNADARYLLWMLDVVEDAEELLKELRVRSDATPESRQARPASP